jgi:hypothetical protein
MKWTERRRRGARASITLILVTCLLSATIASGMCHTGCNTGRELECFACYWATAATADTVVVTYLGPVWDIKGPIEATTTFDLVEVPAPRLASRGPPAL